VLGRAISLEPRRHSEHSNAELTGPSGFVQQSLPIRLVNIRRACRHSQFCFSTLADQVLDPFRPDVLPTYGGHPAGLELMRRAGTRGIAVAF
jgi:hypothetical protein